MNRPENKDIKIGFVSAENAKAINKTEIFVNGKPSVALPIFGKNLGAGKMITGFAVKSDDDNSEE